MIIEVDPDVALVAKFMIANVKARNLYRIAQAIAKLADFVWQPDYIEDPNKPFHFCWEEPIANFAGSPQPLVSTGPCEVGPAESDHSDINGANKPLR